jgi:hypothetical protein
MSALKPRRGAIRTSPVSVAPASHPAADSWAPARAAARRLLLRRLEIDARRQLAAEIARHHDRLRLGLIPPPYKPGPLEW